MLLRLISSQKSGNLKLIIHFNRKKYKTNTDVLKERNDLKMNLDKYEIINIKADF